MPVPKWRRKLFWNRRKSKRAAYRHFDWWMKSWVFSVDVCQQNDILIQLFSVPNPNSYEIKTNSPLESRFKTILQSIIEMGYLQQCEKESFLLIRDFFRKNRTHAHAMDAPNAGTFTSATFNTILPYFFLYGFGIAAAILTFAVEVVNFNYKQKSKEKLARDDCTRSAKTRKKNLFPEEK